MAGPQTRGPIRYAWYLHRAILAEARALQDRAARLDVHDEQGPSTLLARLRDFERILDTHEDAEGLVVFPPLESRYPHIVDTYDFDHRRHHELSTTLVATLGELTSVSSDRRRELLARLGGQTVAFTSFLELHIEKEDSLLFPAYAEAFSAEEQEVHFRATEGKLDEADMARAPAWAFQRLQIDERAGFVREMQAMLPGEAFTGLIGEFAVAIPALEWQELAGRISGLLTPR